MFILSESVCDINALQEDCHHYKMQSGIMDVLLLCKAALNMPFMNITICWSGLSFMEHGSGACNYDGAFTPVA